VRVEEIGFQRRMNSFRWKMFFFYIRLDKGLNLKMDVLGERV
jgi:hypothetical protein